MKDDYLPNVCLAILSSKGPIEIARLGKFSEELACKASSSRLEGRS